VTLITVEVSMKNIRVNLFKRVRTSTGVRCCPVVEAANGRIRPHIVIVDDKEERHEEGAYYISWYEGRSVKRLSVGKDAVEAKRRRDRKETELKARSQGIKIVEERVNGHRSIAVAIADFIEGRRLRNAKPKTLAAYKTSLAYFTESCHKVYLEDLEQRDLEKFAAFLSHDKELHPRTCWNKFANVMSFLKAKKISIDAKGVWPVFTQEDPEIYEPEDLDALFAACDDEERLWFEFFLGTGMREQEVQHVYWRDVNLKASTVWVTHKSDRGWTPKAYKERGIPISDSLVARLKAWKPRSDGRCELLFPTSGCNPKLDFLDCLKAVAERAGLDPSDFWLHKFRATFATRLLRAKLDLASVQKVLGHTDIASTMRYLRAADDETIRAAVNQI
jgi:integrase/recombinase XerD